MSANTMTGGNNITTKGSNCRQQEEQISVIITTVVCK
jgi:hypothetical protein